MCFLVRWIGFFLQVQIRYPLRNGLAEKSLMENNHWYMHIDMFIAMIDFGRRVEIWNCKRFQLKSRFHAVLGHSSFYHGWIPYNIIQPYAKSSKHPWTKRLVLNAYSWCWKISKLRTMNFTLGSGNVENMFPQIGGPSRIFPHIFVWASCFWLCTSASSFRRPPTITTQLAYTTYVTTQLAHTTYSHTTCTHTHRHNLLTQLPHAHTHNLLTHNLLTTCVPTHSHTTCHHTTCSHNLLTHNLLTHNLSPHNLLTHTTYSQLTHHNQLTHTTCSHTTYSHTTYSQLTPHTQLTHTQLVTTQLTHTHTPCSHSTCVAGVALGDIDRHFAWQAWHLWHWLWWARLVPTWRRCRRGSLRGRRGTWWHRPLLCMAGVALGDIDVHSVWQAWHLWHWTGSGGALGSQLTPLSPRLFAWQAWHLATSTSTLRGRRGTWWHGRALCVAGVALIWPNYFNSYLVSLVS